MAINDFFNVTIGNVISMAVWIAGAVMVWQKMRDAIDTLGDRMIKQEQKTDKLAEMGIMTTVAQHERRLAVLETNSEAIQELKVNMKWVMQALSDRTRLPPP
jgi:SpoU rRNA methylase family enzyme